MPIRASRLAKNQSAGCLDETPLRTVHQSPPKNTAPSPPPAAHASTNIDRKSTRLNSSHLGTSYAVFCLKSEDQTPELLSISHLVCRILLEKTLLDA